MYEVETKELGERVPCRLGIDEIYKEFLGIIGG